MKETLVAAGSGCEWALVGNMTLYKRVCDICSSPWSL